MIAQLQTNIGTLQENVLTIAQLLNSHMLMRLTVNNANRMPAINSQFSKMMVNVRNVVTIF
jgi:hypothetical protein